MTHPHDPAAPYPIAPRSEGTTNRRRWPWAPAAILTILFVIGACAPDAETDAPIAQLADSAPITTTVAAAPTTTVPAAPAVALLPAPAPALTVDSPSTATAALTQLSTLDIKGRAPKTGYDRDLFGQSWSDDVTVDGGRNGCDTRNDVLRRDLTAIVATERSGGCVVTTGVLADPYTGTSIAFTRGEGTSSAVQIDHVVALSDAWQKGAQQLDADTLRNFANDPRNLQAVDGPTNSAKGDGDAATWLPPNHEFRCTYVGRQIEVKAEYNLWVTEAEHDAMTRLLTGCGGTASTPVATADTQEAPVVEQAAVPVEVATPAPVYTPAPAAVPAPAQAPSAPAGASARCKDGTYSYSATRRGTCSGHGGVAAWL